MGSYFSSYQTEKGPSTSSNPVEPKSKATGADGTQVEVSSESAADFLDVVFCIDTTGSMSSYIERSKKVIINMINSFSQNEDKPMFGVVAYRDHPPQETSYITKIHNLGSAEDALSFVKQLDASGGGDGPEAVLQGLSDSVKQIKWRNMSIPDKTYKKLVIHVADAPPHGKEFHNDGGDFWPNGCPSGIKLKDLADLMNKHVIFYHFCRLNTSTDKMCEKFKGSFNNFELIDLIVNAESMGEAKKEFESYVKACDVKEYEHKDFFSMSSSVQQECLYEAKVTNAVFKNQKKLFKS